MKHNNKEKYNNVGEKHLSTVKSLLLITGIPEGEGRKTILENILKSQFFKWLKVSAYTFMKLTDLQGNYLQAHHNLKQNQVLKTDIKAT